ncbi:MAG: hypothetical protein JWQ71_4821 [Pedosphaera sp.]|nr:hypothetical protein [Pedosphaera sp.]
MFINLAQTDVDGFNNFMFDLVGIPGVNFDDVIARIMIEAHGLKGKVPSFLSLDAIALNYIDGDRSALALFIYPLAKTLPIFGIHFLHIIVS